MNAMRRFLLQRIGHSLFVLLGVSLLSFLLVALAPGNYLDEMKLNPQIAPETIEALRSQFGLNQPLAARYARWLASVARGEFGYSFAYNRPVSSLLLPRVRNTLLLTLSATLLSWMIALPAGIVAAERKWKWSARLIHGATSVLLSIPNLVLAIGLLMFAVRTRLLPAGGMTSIGFSQLNLAAGFYDLVTHLALPFSALVLVTIPVLIRHVRSAIEETSEAPFIHAARGHGIRPGMLLVRHVLPAAANPLITLFGLSVASLLSGSLVIEVVFSWPGVGPLLLEAILARDLYVVIGSVMISALFLVAGNFLADVLLYWADPRIRMN